MNKKKIYYVYDKKLVHISKNIPNVENRAAVVQCLIATYNLFSKCEICSSDEAEDEDLLSFHSSDYLECLKKAQQSSDLEKMTDSDELLDFNLGYDCPLFENIYEFAKLIAGSSLTAAKKLVNENFKVCRKLQTSDVLNRKPKSYLKVKNCVKESDKRDVFKMPLDFSVEDEMLENIDEYTSENVEKQKIKRYETEVVAIDSGSQIICINWFGGWHHAQRDEAGGFCYVNDIVIAVQYLLKFYKRLLYIDLDIHHGDGVENAFLFSPRVFTFSLHKYEAGFYPSTGSLEDVGKGNGKFYSANVPLRGGITDERYVEVFKSIASKIFNKYQPDCVVVQCGADSLAGDPLGGFNLTSVGIGNCLRFILDKNLPMLVLGGGGYNASNAARCWAYLTSVILDCPISNDIPEHSFLHLYGPEYELSIKPSLRKDENSDYYLQSVVTTVLGNLDNLPNISDM